MYCYCLFSIFHFPLPFSLVPCRPLPLDSLCFCFELNSVQVRVKRSSEASKVEREEKLPNARYFIPIKSTKESVVGSEIAQQWQWAQRRRDHFFRVSGTDDWREKSPKLAPADWSEGPSNFAIFHSLSLNTTAITITDGTGRYQATSNTTANFGMCLHMRTTSGRAFFVV